MQLFILGAGAIGAAALVAVSIVAPFGLSAQPVVSKAASPAPMPASAREGAPAWPIGIPAPSAPTVFFANLADGATVTSPLTIDFGLVGMRVAPAGEVVEGTGHHHLLVNTTLAGEALTQPIVADDQHIHFGAGQRRVTIELPKGRHTLQLVVADGNHVPHQPPVMSKPITVTVR